MKIDYFMETLNNLREQDYIEKELQVIELLFNDVFPIMFAPMLAIQSVLTKIYYVIDKERLRNEEAKG